MCDLFSEAQIIMSYQWEGGVGAAKRGFIYEDPFSMENHTVPIPNSQFPIPNADSTRFGLGFDM